MNGSELKNIEIISTIGHLIVSNNSIHNYQLRYIDRYMSNYNITENYSIISKIFRKQKTQITYDDSIKYFKNESSEVKKDLIKHLIIIAKLDGVLDKEEKKFLYKLDSNYKELIDELDLIVEEKLNLFQEEDKEKRDELDPKMVHLEKIAAYINRIRKIFNDSNLDSKDYIKVGYNLIDFDKLKEISNEDFKFIEPISKDILLKSKELYDNLSRDIKQIKLESNIDDNIKEQLEKSLDVFSKKIVIEIEKMNKELNRKENSLNNFTISLIGKTKVGKSTLHTVLTGEGKEGIGVGKQGTTKYNRIYQWGNLRIVDTPGIESSKNDGEIDEKIAMKIITESDLVCIVLTDDHIGINLFNLIDKIIERNKSVIIILNHKKNIRHPIRYREFINQSKSWITDKGTKGLQGHLKRLNKFIKSKKYEHKVKIYPVFLGSAILAMEDKYKKDKLTLIDGSNIDEFKSHLRREIKNNGIKMKSQTLLDDSGKILKSVRLNLVSVETYLKEIIVKIENSKKTAFDKINQEEKKLLESIKQEVKKSFNKLRNDYTHEFAVENYNSNNINEKWNNFIKERQFYKNLNLSIELEISDFKITMEKIMKNMSKEIEVGLETSINISSINLKFIDFDFNKFFKRLANLANFVRIFSKVISNRMHKILNLAPYTFNLLASNFKSKEAKRLDAITKLEKNIIKAINESEKKITNNIVSDIKKAINKNILNVKNTIEIHEKQLKKNKDTLSKIIRLHDISIESIEERYNKRLLNLN